MQRVRHRYPTRPKLREKKKGPTSLQYSPHALQFSSSLSPRRQSGVCVAPQFEHSALTPPGAELLVVFCWVVLTGVADGPVERVLTDCVRTLRDGRLPLVVVVVIIVKEIGIFAA